MPRIKRRPISAAAMAILTAVAVIAVITHANGTPITNTALVSAVQQARTLSNGSVYCAKSAAHANTAYCKRWRRHHSSPPTPSPTATPTASPTATPTPTPTPTATPTPTPKPTPTPTPTPPNGSNTAAVCGTWSLIEASSSSQLTANAALDASLTTPGLKGLSVRVPGTAIASNLDVLTAGYNLAQSHGVGYTIRFMAGTSTPTQDLGNAG